MRLVILILAILISACSSQQKSSAIQHEPIDNSDPNGSHDSTKRNEPIKPASDQMNPFCTDEWYRYVESQVSSSDAMGHGPDLGSKEWQSSIEFKLGLQSDPNLPSKSTPEWCAFIQNQLDTQRNPPSFSCQDKALNTVEKQICQSKVLSNLDVKMKTVFEKALKKVILEESRELKAEQRGWIKGRDDCWKSEPAHLCIAQRYQYRIAELQVEYQLIDALGPMFYVCDGRPLDEIIVTFYSTEPPSILAERAGQVSFMLLQETASGAKYQGPNETFWEHQGQASVIWGADSSTMTCEKMH